MLHGKYVFISIIVSLFSRQLFKNMAADFLSYQAPHQTCWLSLLWSTVPRYGHGLLNDLSFAPAPYEFPSCRVIGSKQLQRLGLSQQMLA